MEFVSEKNIKRVFIALEIIFGMFLVWKDIFPNSPYEMRTTFFNIGQGDSTLIETPSRKRVLVDGGPDKTVLYKLGEISPRAPMEIDAVILSHPHSDHLTGILEVLKRYPVKKIFLSRPAIDTPEYFALLEYFEKSDLGVNFVDSKLSYIIDGVEFRFLHPEGSNFHKNINNDSVLVQAVFGKNKILFTGDLEKEGQEENFNENLASDILKVPHQGSSDSLNEEFLQKVSPRFAVISVGKNNYGHPSPRVIKSLERMKIFTLITQDDGDIRFLGNGNILEYQELYEQ